MTGREKLKTALDHRAGPVPVDFGATSISGMHVSIIAGLRQHYGLERRPVKVIEPYQMLGEVDEELRKALGIDVVGVWGRGTMFGFPLEHWKTWRAPWGQEVLVPGDFNVTMNGEEVLMHPQGDTGAPPSARMPAGGYFFDAIIRQPPIDEDALDPADNTEEFGDICTADLEHFQAAARTASETGCGTIASFGGTAFGDIALVPAPFAKHPRGIRDVAEWYMSLVARQDYVHAVFRTQLEYALANLERIRDAVDTPVDAAVICGTDFGTQSGQFCSPATFEELWLPYYKKVNDWIHANTEWKCFKHSCGAVYPLMPKFIEAGFDIINPVQCSAADMEPEKLKAEFGRDLVFWGGGVDTQKTLPFGTTEEVRREVLRQCEVFARDGGFVFNTVHNVQALTPIANVIAMLDAVREFNG